MKASSQKRVSEPCVDNLTEEFRQTMRRLATTIAIVTASGEGGDVGMAATSVASVCAEPPTLSVAVNRSASLFPVMAANERFCVNLLAQRHENLVEVFAGKEKGLQRFVTGNWTTSKFGIPVLSDALASAICTTVAKYHIGTHMIFIGRVQEVAYHKDIDPLIWVDGTFGALVSNA